MKNSESTTQHKAHISVQNMQSQNKFTSKPSTLFPPIFKSDNLNHQINFISDRKINSYSLEGYIHKEELRQRALTKQQKFSQSQLKSEVRRYSSLMHQQLSQKPNKRVTKQQLNRFISSIQRQLKSNRQKSFTKRFKRSVIDMKPINIQPNIPDFKKNLVKNKNKSLAKKRQKIFNDNYQYIKNISQQISKFQTIQTRPSMFEIVEKKMSLQLDPIPKKNDASKTNSKVHKKQYKSMTLQKKKIDKNNEDEVKIQEDKKIFQSHKLIIRQISEDYRYEPWHFQDQMQQPYEINQSIFKP